MTDDALMQRALALAARGRGWVNPNPMVGAVIVRDGEIVGEGYHPKVGEPHAEVFALQEAGERARGATLYVTLEPCSHHGRTPPCTEAIVRAGVAKVVFACWDENVRTARQSLATLEGAGIAVVAGIAAGAARELNAPFFKFVRTGMPYVMCKMAMSLDGKIATGAGQSRWISGPAARDQVQEWRATYSAVMVGIGTVLADDPSLTCRIAGAHSPVRAVVDPLAQTPPAARFLAEPGGPAIVAVGPDAPEAAIGALEARGAEIVRLPTRRSAGGAPGEFSSCADSAGGQRVESVGRTGAESADGASVSTIGSPSADLEGLLLTELLRDFSRREISSVLVEGGGGLNAALLREGLVDRVAFFVAPLLIGGRGAPTPMDGADIAELADGIRVNNLHARSVGDDILLEADF